MTPDTAYRRTPEIEAAAAHPLEYTPDWYKYMFSAYLYMRSRLLMPGRAYDTDETGMLSVGGSAHVDLLDIDVWLQAQPDETRMHALAWALDAGPEDVAYWRKLGRGYSRTTAWRHRSAIVSSVSATAK